MARYKGDVQAVSHELLMHITEGRVAKNIEQSSDYDTTVVHESPEVPPISDEWSLLNSKVQKCKLCPLSHGRMNVVFGSGDVASPVYIVGEAPGKDEDIAGKPFVGRAGLLLTRMLEAIAIGRDSLFITNLIKCRPPENRSPEMQEINLCRQHLEAQLALGKPKIVLSLGRFSTGYLLNDYKTPISKIRGRTYTIQNGIILVPTFHPAAVLRSPERWKPLVWEDLKLLATILLTMDYYNPSQREHLKRNKVLL